MKFPIFELERVQSLYENTVEYNLTESGLHPLGRRDGHWMDRYFRIGIGAEKNYLMAGLDRVRSALAGRFGVQEHSR